MRMRPGLVLLMACLCPGGLQALVRFSEIAYNPDGDDAVEYVELYNDSPDEVDLLGWSLTEGITYSFRESQVLAPGGTLVLARDPAMLREEFAVATAVVLPFEGRLDNGGETLRLVNGAGDTVEVLTYDDRYPFDPAADGEGAALELACLARPAAAPFNWRAAPHTPGRHIDRAECDRAAPRTEPAQFPVVISEIHYHPPGDVEPLLEYVELAHRGAREVDLSGWSFDRGIRYVFPDGTRLQPGEFVVVAQDPEVLIAEFGEVPGRVLGPFGENTRLSNSGESLRLVDSAGAVQDALTYREDGAWPAFADGLGGSLQRVDLNGPSEAPGNWRIAPLLVGSPQWQSVEVRGTQQGSLTQFRVSGAGAFLLDDVSLVTEEDATTELILNGDFSGGADGWEPVGGYADSEWQPTGGFGDDGPCMLVRSNGTIRATDAFQQRLATRPGRRAPVIFRFRIKYVSGDRRVIARSSLGSPVNTGVYHESDVLQDVRLSPGEPNSVADGDASSTPPTLEFVERFPSWPTASDEVTIVARTEDRDVAEVSVAYRIDDGPEQILSLDDDGAGPDAIADDGFWTVRLPAAPDGSLVWFSLRATTIDGVSTLWPRWRNQAPVSGYYVVDELPATNDSVGLFYLFTPGALEDLSCGEAEYRQGAVVDPSGRAYFGAGIKFRGETACGYTKRPLRVRFNKGDRWNGRSRINFMAGWQDKGIMRVKTGFDLFGEAAVAHSETKIVRVHSNGGLFHGTYAMVEDPRPDFLERNQRDPDGGLYKARTPMLNGAASGYEPRTDRSTELLTVVGEFAGALNTLEGEALVDHLLTELDVEGVIDYQTIQSIIIDGDSVAKNWLLYYGTDARRPGLGPLISMFPWDIDLSFGQMYLTTDERHYDIHPLFHTETYPFVGQGHHGIVNALLERSPGDFFVKAFYGRMWTILQEKFAPEILFPKLDEYAMATEEVVVLDLAKWPRTWGERGDDPFFWREDFRTFIERRYEFLTSILVSDHPTTQGRRFRYTPAPRVRITEIHYNPEGSDDAEFVELTNYEEEAVSLSGWNVPAVEFTFPEDAGIGAGESVLLARDPAVLKAQGIAGPRMFGPYSGRLSNGGEVLRLRDSGEGGRFYPETVDMVVYDDERGWPAAADGGGRTLELIDRLVDNDHPDVWRGGGSPGTVATGNRPPVAVIGTTAEGTEAPLRVLFDATASQDPDGDPLSFEWSLPGGGTDTRPVLLLELATPGTWEVALTVRDRFGGEHRASVSIMVGGEVSPRFLRGDVDGDGRTRLPDPIHLLGVLFRGAGAIACDKSADADDDGTLGVGDAIYLLDFLFRGGPALPAPFPRCGADRTADSLACSEACS